MGISVGIEDGLIVVMQPLPGERRTFVDEGDAVDLVAERACEEGESVDFGISCDAPAANGRPGFTKAGFLDRLQDSIYEIRTASSPRM